MSESLEEMMARDSQAIVEAGAQTEEQMRDSEAPWPKSVEELEEYVRSLVERPHDYGTCVYAMNSVSGWPAAAVCSSSRPARRRSTPRTNRARIWRAAWRSVERGTRQSWPASSRYCPYHFLDSCRMPARVHFWRKTSPTMRRSSVLTRPLTRPGPILRHPVTPSGISRRLTVSAVRPGFAVSFAVFAGILKRRRPDSNRGIADLQSGDGMPHVVTRASLEASIERCLHGRLHAIGGKRRARKRPGNHWDCRGAE